MHNKAKTVKEYLEKLSEERKQAILKVRDVILQNLPVGIVEVMNWGMITYQIPLELYPNTYNGQPLMFAALASQKNHMAIYLSGVYSDDKLREKFIAEYKATGNRLDIGKSCVRFRKIDDLPLELIGKVISAIDVKSFIEIYSSVRSKKKEVENK